jgi:hypothetical protein
MRGRHIRGLLAIAFTFYISVVLIPVVLFPKSVWLEKLSEPTDTETVTIYSDDIVYYQNLYRYCYPISSYKSDEFEVFAKMDFAVGAETAKKISGDFDMDIELTMSFYATNDKVAF